MGVIIGKTLPLLFLPGVFPLKQFQNKTLPGVSKINFLVKCGTLPLRGGLSGISKNIFLFTVAQQLITSAPLIYKGAPVNTGAPIKYIDVLINNHL